VGTDTLRSGEGPLGIIMPTAALVILWADVFRRQYLISWNLALRFVHGAKRSLNRAPKEDPRLERLGSAAAVLRT
jgi:hypothetical protein